MYQLQCIRKLQRMLRNPITQFSRSQGSCKDSWTSRFSHQWCSNASWPGVFPINVSIVTVCRTVWERRTKESGFMPTQKCCFCYWIISLHRLRLFLRDSSSRGWIWFLYYHLGFQNQGAVLISMLQNYPDNTATSKLKYIYLYMSVLNICSPCNIGSISNY